MEIGELFGLPAHPLVVHAAVVLLPLAAITTTLICAAVPRARRHHASVALGLVLVATLAVGLAQGSGEALEEQVDETELVEAHTARGERVLPWAIAVPVAAAAVAAMPLLARRPSMPARTVTAAVVAVFVSHSLLNENDARSISVARTEHDTVAEITRAGAVAP